MAALERVASNALELTGIFHCEITPEAPTPDSRYISFHHLDNNSEGYWNAKACFMSFFILSCTVSQTFSYYNYNLYAVIKLLGSHLETIRHLLMPQSPLSVAAQKSRPRTLKNLRLDLLEANLS